MTTIRHGSLLLVFGLLLTLGLMAGCADISDKPVEEEDDSELPTIYVDIDDIEYECFNDCPDDDAIPADRIARADLTPIDYDRRPFQGVDDETNSDDNGGDDADEETDNDADEGNEDDTDDSDDNDGDTDEDSGEPANGDSGDEGSDDEIAYCDLDEEMTECPNSLGYWKNNGDDWPDDYDPDAECEDGSNNGACLCGESWSEILDKAPKGDLWVIIAQQRITAMLNAENGACDAELEEYLQLSAPLVDNCGTQDNDEDLVEELAGRLKLFNQGALSPECLE